MSSQTIQGYSGYPAHYTNNPFDSLTTTSDPAVKPSIWSNFPRQEETPVTPVADEASEAKIIVLIPGLSISRATCSSISAAVVGVATRIKDYLFGDGIRLLGAMAAVLTTAAIMKKYPCTFSIPIVVHAGRINSVVSGSVKTYKY